MSSSTIHVKGLSGQSEKELRGFFSFCGAIQSISVTPESGEHITEASVTFAKESAAKTAQLLDGTQLGKSTISVTSAASLSDLAPDSHDEHHDGEVPQELKPRARLMAEYLASGYKIADTGLTKAIELDNKHGITSRFQTYLQQIDQKTNATTRAVAADQKLGVTKTLNNAFLGLSSYFQAAVDTPQGAKLHQYYQTGFANANDIHQEALRLSGLKDKHTQGSDGVYKAESVGNGKTHCGCGGEDKVCGCSAGSCTCADCPKKSSTTSGTGLTATGQADTIAASTNVAPLGEKK